MKAIVLGGTKGMGRAIARRLAERGDAVFLMGRDEAELGRSAADLEARYPAGAAGAAGAARPLDPEAKRAYDAALILVNARRCDRALDALASFLVKWPDHPYADNAMYWRGECYFARADYERASEQFEGVLARYPAGNKAPDALLKLGVCQQKLGDGAKAKASFDRLAEQYPQSDAARRISQAPGLGAATAPVGTTAPPAPGPQDRRP